MQPSYTAIHLFEIRRPEILNVLRIEVHTFRTGKWVLQSN